MKHWEITDTGLIRHENQDAFGFAQLPGGYAVAVVCDGMGGVAGGSIASTVAVETFIRTLTETGHSGHMDQAVQEAGTVVAVPGTSEHQLGLAVDLVDANMQDLTSAQESTETQKWLMANSWRYGFIHRYPNGKTDITGIIYEPWHYRYVGKDAAQEIFNRDITLEEYLGKTEH